MRGVITLVIVIAILIGVYLYLNPKGEQVKAAMAEKEGLRQEEVKKELAYTVVEPMVTDLIARLKSYPGVTEDEIVLYRDGVRKLMEAAPLIKLLYQRQIGAHPDDRIHAVTDDDRELIDRYSHPWCLADTSDLCVALPALPKRISGVIPDGVGCEEANSIGSPFEVIERSESDRLVAVPYAVVWSGHLRNAAVILRDAAAIFGKIEREQKFAAHLYDVADAFESKEPYPFYKSDKSWNELLASDSLFFIRVGPDEVGGDGVGDNCECKARYHFNLAMVNNSAVDVVNRLTSAASRFEKSIADLINDPKNYIATDVKVQLPVFLDVIYANGDDVGGPSGTPVGQTLPNWCGKDGKTDGLRGTMVYVNKSVKAYSDKIMRKYILPLFVTDLKDYFNPEAGLDSVVYHEIFHNIGPKDKKKKPGREDTYGEFLVARGGESWRLPLEELKAQTGSMFMASEFYKDAKEKREKGELGDDAFAEETRRFREHVIYDIAWALRMILRASRSGPEFSSRSPYSRLAAVQIGFFAEQGALKYDDADKIWSIDFEKMPEAVTALMKKTGDLYVKSDVNAVQDFFLYYMKGDGEKLLHRDRLVEVAGGMPSVLFDYRLKGLD